MELEQEISVTYFRMQLEEIRCRAKYWLEKKHERLDTGAFNPKSNRTLKAKENILKYEECIRLTTEDLADSMDKNPDDMRIILDFYRNMMIPPLPAPFMEYE